MEKFRRKWRYLACLLSVLVLVLSPYHIVRAATVTTFKDTLSDSRPTTVSNHEIKWDVVDAGGIAGGESFVLTFASAFDTASIAVGDVDIAGSTAGELTLAANCAATDKASFVNGGDDTFTFTICAGDGGDIASAEVVTIEIGTNAAGGSNQITNSTAASYTISMAGVATYTDTGQLQVAVIAYVTATATVTASLSVLVEAVADTETVNGQDLDITSTASTMPFGTLTANTYKAGAHDITVSTNALEGYTTTIRQLDGTGMIDILSSGTNNIDGFRGGAGTATNAAPLAWAAGTNPTGSSANDQTGWYGYTTEDAVLGTGSADRFTTPGNYWAPFDVTPYEVMYASTPVSAQKIRVGHMIEVNALQPTGTLYTGVIEYICTAIF